MKRLLQINVTANWGSTGHIAEDIGQIVMTNGWQSHIAYGRNITNSISNAYKIGNKWSIYFHVLQTRLFDRHGLESKKATCDLIQYIEQIHPNIIHLHNIHGYFLNYPILFDYLSKADIPIVWTLHDCWPFTGHCAYYDFTKCSRWKTGCYDCPQKKEYPASLFLDRSMRNYIDKKHWFTTPKKMTIVSVSNWLAGEIKKSFLGHYPIKVIHNGIDTDIFKPYSVNKKAFGLDGKFVILGVASVWSQRKGLADFIKLRGLLPDDYAILLIGLDKKQISELPTGIVGLSRTNNIQELAEYYSMADVYINTSVEETLGMTTIESLACGTPAIVYEATACTETISPECGFAVTPHDIKRIIELITYIKSLGTDVYSTACRNRAVKHFNKADRFNEYFTLYNSLISK